MDEVEKLQKELARLRKVNAVLVRRVENAMDLHDDAFSLFQIATSLEEKVRERTRELEEARDAAEVASRAKSEFLSSMSHELRTPLNAVLGFAQLLGYDDNLTDEQKKNIGEIEKAGRHLLDLINDVLDLEKIELGSIRVSIEGVDLPSILDECQSLTKSQAEELGIRITYECLDSSLWVNADYTRLKQIILNLVSNAVKYNRRGGEVRVLCRMAGDEQVRITVQDTGMGIEKKHLGRLFEPFNRLGVEGSNIEGTGIGLVITKQLVELMGGVIGVDTKKDIGSTFWFELPGYIDKVTEGGSFSSEGLITTHSNDSTATDDSTAILIVEDNPTNQALLLQQIKLLGYSAEIAGNGKEAKQRLQGGSYCLVLTDCNMPVMDGYQLAESIRQDEVGTTRHLPVIAITANALNGEDEKCFSAGMDDYLPKPVDLGELKNVLKKWIPKSHMLMGERVDKNNVESTSERKIENPPVDLSVLIAQVGDDPEIYNNLLQLFIDSSPEIVDSILKGRDTRSVETISFASHKLKSPAAAIGALALAELTRELESVARRGDWEAIDKMCFSLEVLFNEVVEFITLQMDDAAESRESKAESPVNDLSDLRVLLVDDDPIMLGQVAMVLGKLGINNVVSANGGTEALQILQALDDSGAGTDLVLCDLNMPEMDGVTFLRHLAERSYQGGIAFISGMDKQVLRTVEELARAHQLNILGILEKPVSRAMLAELVQHATRRVPEGKSEKSDGMMTEEELRSGISGGALTVHYQPKIDVVSGKLVGVETLARWFDPLRGNVSPGLFIPLVEQYGLMEELTQTVFTQAITQAGLWRDDGLEIKIAVNFSMSSFNNRLDLPEWLEGEVRKVNIDASNIIIEVTESGLMENRTTSLEVLSRIRLKGFTLSIDDFGTGFSSMEQLQRLPFSELKIDRAFVAGAVSDPSRRAIFESSADLAKKLGLSVVAEGVETQEDWDLAKKLGCDLIQGFFVARPMPANEFEQWVADWEKRASS